MNKAHRIVVNHGFCPYCYNPISKDEFKDENSRIVYKITGKCQKCQDKGR